MFCPSTLFASMETSHEKSATYAVNFPNRRCTCACAVSTCFILHDEIMSTHESHATCGHYDYRHCGIGAVCLRRATQRAHSDHRGYIIIAICISTLEARRFATCASVNLLRDRLEVQERRSNRRLSNLSCVMRDAYRTMRVPSPHWLVDQRAGLRDESFLRSNKWLMALTDPFKSLCNCVHSPAARALRAAIQIPIHYITIQ